MCHSMEFKVSYKQIYQWIDQQMLYKAINWRYNQIIYLNMNTSKPTHRDDSIKSQFNANHLFNNTLSLQI